MDVGASVEPELEKQSYSGNPLFTNELTQASKLGETLSGRYGHSWLEWSPDTLRVTLERDFHTEIHPVNWEKILAVQVLLLTDDSWLEWQVFFPVATALNSQVPDFGAAGELSPGEMAWAVEEMGRIREEEFGDEVKLFIRANCMNHGMLVFPEQLAFAQGPMNAEEEAIKKSWEEKSGMSPMPPFEETVEGVQLARLAAVREYVKIMDREGIV